MAPGRLTLKGVRVRHVVVPLKRPVVSKVGLFRDWPLVVADSSDPAALRALAESTRVLATTVGPYARYGLPVVASTLRIPITCAATRSDCIPASVRSRQV